MVDVVVDEELEEVRLLCCTFVVAKGECFLHVFDSFFFADLC